MQRRILIADGIPANRIVFRVKLTDAFYQPLLAADGAGCLRMARTEQPDLILMSFDMPDRPGPVLLAALRGDPATCKIPVIAFVPPGDAAARLAAFRAGADDVMSRPPDMTVLLARIRNLLRQREEASLMAGAWGGHLAQMPGLAEPAADFAEAGEIGLVATRPETALAWKHRLGGPLRNHAHVLSAEEASGIWPGERAVAPSVFLIEADLGTPGGGLRLMSQLSGGSTTRHSMFCVMASPHDPAAAAMAFDLGAEDVMAPGTGGEELELRLQRLLRRKSRSDSERKSVEDGLRLSLIDPLTGAYNRRYALPRLAGIAEQAAAAGSDFAVMIVDLDRFKSVNDRYGHAAGDAVLIEVVRRLSENLRMNDLLARIGGEEFLIALPETSQPEAERIAERLRRIVGDTPVAPGPGRPGLPVTISIGLKAAGGAQVQDIGAMIDEADGALRRSKTAGRNVVTLCHSAA